MKTYEKYKRIIKCTFAAVMAAVLVAAFAYIWIEYYNAAILQRPYFRKETGRFCTLWLSTDLPDDHHGGFRVGFLKRGNLIYSQILSLVLTNIFTYGEIAIIDRHFLDARPLVVMAVGQAAFVVVWTLLFQAFYEAIFPPKRLLLISGDRSEQKLVKKFDSRKDKYIIERAVDYRMVADALYDEMHGYDAVMIGDIPSEARNRIIKECFARSIRTYSVPKISDILIRSSVDLNLFDSPILLSRNAGLTVEQQWVKRLVDVVISGLAAVVTLPIFALIAIAIKLTDGGPVFLYSDENDAGRQKL